VLKATTTGGHIGLCILLREGTAAWMDHICSSTPIEARIKTAPTQRTTDTTTPRLDVDGIGADFVDVLVSMVTAGQTAVRTYS
jgi:hypothetical protein